MTMTEGAIPDCASCRRPSGKYFCNDCDGKPRGNAIREGEEWKAIARELTDAKKDPSAFDVSEEQRRRAAARGERLSTLAEAQSDYEAHLRLMEGK